MAINREILLATDRLLAAVESRTRAALESGALQPIETEQAVIEDSGLRFVVRVVSSLSRKEHQKHHPSDPERSGGSPFDPPEPELTVGQISPTHLAVLNKYNVLQQHLLIATRSFEHQESLLTIDDFHALLVCVAAYYDGLGFYNGGTIAGASQMHKHLQVVPVAADLPIEPLLGGPGPHCPSLPFAHAFGRLGAGIRQDPIAAAPLALDLYQRLLQTAGITAVAANGDQRQSAPYNLLLANDWMLIVPRSRECFHDISINALGFAGSLFVRNRGQLDLIRRTGPVEVLRSVAGTAS
jgi:ATP adenylyltransferase